MVWPPHYSFPTLDPQHFPSTPSLSYSPLPCDSLLSSESKLDSIRKDILTHVQNECWTLSQQLITELMDFTEVFQTINSDIHTIARCSQKVGFSCLSFPAYPGAHFAHMLSTLFFRSLVSSQWGLMLLN